MALGRAATFAGILVVSLVAAREVLRHRRPALLPSRPAGPVRRVEPPRVARPAPSAPPPPRRPAGDVGGRDPDPLGDALCPEGMVLGSGTTCAETGHRCKVRDASLPAGCAEYEPAHCQKGLALRFCVDRDEYPNQAGMLPAAVVTFEEAEAACEGEGKRLCTEMEWTFACEGESGLAFPYGDVRDASACNVGREVPKVLPEELWEPRDVSSVLERVDARTASGAMPRCVSPVGARDMIGNVEEWVRSDTTSDARALRGGEYTGDPTCGAVRKMRTAGYRQFHTGFRCCRDPLVRLPASAPQGSHETPESSARPVAPPPRFD